MSDLGPEKDFFAAVTAVSCPDQRVADHCKRNQANHDIPERVHCHVLSVGRSSGLIHFTRNHLEDHLFQMVCYTSLVVTD